MKKHVEEIISIHFGNYFSDAFCADVGADVFLFFGPLRNVGFSELTPRLGSNPLRKKVIFVLETDDGEISTAYEIVCNLYKLYESVSLYVPTQCHGAGALIAHAVDELILGEDAEVGPLDGFGKRLAILSSKAGTKAFEHLAGIDQSVGLTINSQVRHLFDNVSEPSDTLKYVTEGIVKQFSLKGWEESSRAAASGNTVQQHVG
jgi:hypothetical protein